MSYLRDNGIITEKQYVGKTPAYMLDAYGFDESNLDVTVRTDFKINGVLTNEEYVWTVKFTTKFGRKLQDSRWLGTLNPEKNFKVRKTIDLQAGIEFDDSRLTINNFEIRNALIEGLTDLIDTFFIKYKPIDSLQLAQFKRTDVTKQKPLQ